MTILSTDIKLLESERMRDTDDGGGRMTSREIPDGVVGNIFPKVSRLDSVYGRVNLRKIYLAVKTATLDVYAGAHMVITDAPDNDRIRCLLFSTGSHFDDRSDARNMIESYVVSGPESRWMLFGNQIVGQKAITLFARESEPLPDVGDVLCLSVETGPQAGTYQFVRIIDVSSEVRWFTDERSESLGDFARRILTLKLSNALRQTFVGDNITRNSKHSVTDATRVRETQVADASKYYGIQPLTESASAGALTLRVSSAYDSLVPAAIRESPISMASIASSDVLIPAADDPIVLSWGVNVLVTSGAGSMRLPSRPVPGSVVIEAKNNATTISRLVDSGAGDFSAQLVGTTSALTPATIDYETGAISYTNGNGMNPAVWSITVQYLPAVNADVPAHTHGIPVSLATRGSVYGYTLSPIPAPGSLVVDYRAMGRWYRMRDNGLGVLVGNAPGVGTGDVDYVTGGVVITLGALPDVGSAVILSWGASAHYKILTTNTEPITKVFELTGAPIAPASATFSWHEGGVARSATANAAGIVSGTTASGALDHATGRAVIHFQRTPDAEVSVAYSTLDDTGGGAGGPYAAGTAIQPRSVFVWVRLHLPNGTYAEMQASDDGVGNIRISPTLAQDLLLAEEYKIGTTTILGSVDYLAGTMTLLDEAPLTQREWLDGSWAQAGAVATIVGEEWSYATTPASSVASFEVGPDVPITIQLGKADPMYIVPGSVVFTAAGRTYFDRAGRVVSDIDPITAAGVDSGSINYTTGIVVLDDIDLATANLNVISCLGRYGEWTMTSVVFRTPGAPVRQTSLYVQATTPSGGIVSATADVNGDLVGAPGVTGTINHENGVVTVSWGQEVMPSTLRFSCVIQTSLPLDAELLGIDPVRLPSDGRVAIFRPGDVCVVHDTQDFTLPNPVSAGTTYAVGRASLSLLELIDADGHPVPTAKYVTDLEAGTVTMAADLDLVGYTQPLIARHRVEDMVLLSDVQINGELSLAGPTNHDYTANSRVSSALLFGDLEALVTNVFDQQTWTGEWSNTLIGSQATGQFNDLDHPIEVLNESAIRERWRIHFTSSTAFQVHGESLGQIATGTTSADLAPINPVTGLPYFVLRATGWGGGWAAGNQLRFNTEAANAPAWIARVVLAGATLSGDSFDLAGRGDVD